MAIPTFNVSLIPRFPANVVGDGPVTVDKNGLTYTLGFDITSYAENPTPSVNTRVLSYDPSSETTGLIELSDFATPVIDARLADVPTAIAGEDDEELITSLTTKASIVANAKDGNWLPTVDAVPTTIAQNLAWHLNAKHFGATGDGVTDDTAAIRKAVAHLKLIGGGRLYFPAGTYIVHVASPDYSSATWDAAGILVDFSNLHMFGDGAGSTTIKCLDDQDNYCVMHYGVVPLQNGTPAIENCSLRGMTIDGNNANPAPSLATRSPAILCRGLKNCRFTDLLIKDSGMYGIGLQNGGHQEVTVDSVTFDNCGRNAIDVKNNGSVNQNIIFSNIRIRHCAWADFIDEKPSCISITGIGCHLNNIIIWDIPTTANSVGQVVRIKPGTESFTQGIGGRDTTINNLQIHLPDDAAPPSLERVIEVGCERPILSNIVIKGKAPIGIAIMQPGATVNGFLIDGPDTGIHIRPRQIADDDVQPYPAGTNSSIVNGKFYNCGTVGILNNADATSMIGNYFESCAIGINNSGSGGANAQCFGNRFDPSTVPVKIRGDSGTGAFWHDNPEAINPVLKVALTTNEGRTGILNAQNGLRFTLGGQVTAEEAEQQVLWLNRVANAVNCLEVYPSPTNNPAILAARGADTNVGLRLQPKGNAPVLIPIANVRDYADDAAAAGGGLAVGSIYRTGSALKIRVS